MRLPAFLRDALDWVNGSAEEPLRLIRLTAGGLLLFGTVVALGLAVSGMTPRALELVAVFWALYGFVAGITSGVMEPVIDGIAHALQNFGLMRAGGGYSAIETMAVRGRIAEAAEAYRERARSPRDRVEATVRRAALLAGPLAQPETAVVELEGLQRSELTPREDLRVGLALVDLYDRRLAEPGKAMVELRRLIDRHPEDRGIRRLRGWLAAMKSEHFETLDPRP
ncbi:MAG TPA: hypothetical protein VFT84_14515 [Gemmatimonadales bacterium]|nr:hypothetical protein [Gemmatimonadales bacterium]